jgi:hypothetical protein
MHAMDKITGKYAACFTERAAPSNQLKRGENPLEGQLSLDWFGGMLE